MRRLLVFNHSTDEPAARIFPLALDSAADRRRALLRQELCGLTIDCEARTLLSRPMHKIWVLGTRPELRHLEERWILRPDEPICLLRKLDGVSVFFWEVGSHLCASTCAGRTSAAIRVERYVNTVPGSGYVTMIRGAVRMGFTPIFFLD